MGTSFNTGSSGSYMSNTFGFNQSSKAFSQQYSQNMFADAAQNSQPAQSSSDETAGVLAYGLADDILSSCENLSDSSLLAFESGDFGGFDSGFSESGGDFSCEG